MTKINLKYILKEIADINHLNKQNVLCCEYCILRLIVFTSEVKELSVKIYHRFLISIFSLPLYFQPKSKMVLPCVQTVLAPAHAHPRSSVKASWVLWGDSLSRGSGGGKRRAKNSKQLPSVSTNKLPLSLSTYVCVYKCLNYLS